MNIFTSALSARSRVVEVGQNRPLSLYLPVGSAIYSVVGKLWITQEGVIDDIVVSAGDRFDVRRKGQIVVSAIDEAALAYLAAEGNSGPAMVGATPEVLDALIARAVRLRRREMSRLVRLAARYVRQALRRLKTVWHKRRRSAAALGQPSHS